MDQQDQGFSQAAANQLLSQRIIQARNGHHVTISHRRSPSELTPLTSAFAQGVVDPAAFQHQQMVLSMYQNIGLPLAQMPSVPYGGGAAFTQNPIPPNQLHRRNQSTDVPTNTGMATSSGPLPSRSGYESHSNNRESAGSNNRGRGGGGHQRRHSLALPDAKKAAEIAQQKRTTSSFQFPSVTSEPTAEGDEKDIKQDAEGDKLASDSIGPSQGRSGYHNRSWSMATGRGGGAGRGSSHDGPENQGGGFSARSSGGHGRTPSRNFEGSWRQPPKDAGQQGFQPGHRSRGSINQSVGSIGAFQYTAQPQLVPFIMPNNQPLNPMQLNQGLNTMQPNQPLNALQLNQMQALQAQMNSQNFLPMLNHQVGQQAGQLGGPMVSQQQQQQQQRKTLFTPYLPQASLPALLADGQLVSGILRVNKKNRSDAYVSTQDSLLDADIFICGSKDRNRALEGDLVAIELLDVDEVWSQKREKEEKKKRKDITDTRSGSTNGGSQSNAAGDESGVPEPGIRRRGSLRQRPTQKKNDDVEVEGQSLLLVEEEEISDEQKPLYAGHVVAVIERAAGQMFSGTLGLLRPSSQATKEKQEAERAARDGSTNRQYDNRQQDKPKIVWFKPTDKRVPLIAIPTEQAPRDFVEKHQDYADRIFVACIKRWPITSLHPFGTLIEQLGRMGDLKVETDALLRDNNFASDDFSDAVLRSVGLQDWSVEKEEAEVVSSRRDYRDEQTFTLDFNGSSELGHAIHVKRLPDGIMDIGIHVPDVTHFVKPNSLVDREAKKRGTAVQLVNRFCAMLPPKLSSDVCSLIPGSDRLTFSVVFRVDVQTGAVSDVDTWTGKAIIKSSTKMSLQDINETLNAKGLPAGGSFDASDLQALNTIAQKFREVRLRTDGGPIAPLRLFRQLDDEVEPVQHNLFESSAAMEMVEELLHQANAHVAQRLAKALPEKALLRQQMPPAPRRLQTFVDRMAALGYDIDPSSSGTLQNSLFNVEDVDLRKGMETLLLKSMQRARYFIAGKMDKTLWSHYALNLPLYTHFTNPARRYADLVVHRQLEAVLSEGRIEYTDDMDNLVKAIEACNTKKDSAQNAQEQSIHIESCRTMDKKRQEVNGELISEGIVLCVYESAFDVLIPEWGFEKRVHCDQLPLKKAEFRKEKRVLELYWEKGVPSSAYVPEDEKPKAAASLRASNVVAAVRHAEAKRERDEVARKQTETGTISTDDVSALFEDEEDNGSDMTEAMAGVSLAERPTQSVPGSPARSTPGGALHRTRSESKVPAVEAAETHLTTKEKYLKLFTLREDGGEFIQDVTEMTRVPVILKTDLSKSPPCLTIRSLNPYAL